MFCGRLGPVAGSPGLGPGPAGLSRIVRKCISRSVRPFCASDMCVCCGNALVVKSQFSKFGNTGPATFSSPGGLGMANMVAN